MITADSILACLGLSVFLMGVWYYLRAYNGPEDQSTRLFYLVIGIVAMLGGGGVSLHYLWK